VLQALEWKHNKGRAGVNQDIGHITPCTLMEVRYFNARSNKIHGKSFLFLLLPELDLSRLEFSLFYSVTLFFKPASFQAALGEEIASSLRSSQ